MNVEPVLKWAGGKRWLTRNCEWLFPSRFSRLVEPFLGGAAVFLSLKPESALISDLNRELIELYIAIRDDWHLVQDGLIEYASLHSDDFYYQVRESREVSTHRRAARFLYLNRTCWNGLYRVNLRGQFNVPRGTKNKVLLETDDFAGLSLLLKHASISTCDFSDTLKQAREGDFVFLDPPYTVAHNNNGFLKYNEQIFSWSDQLRLRDEAAQAASRGAKVLVLNAHHNSVVDLYKGIGTLHKLPRHSVISGAAGARKPIDELAVQIGYSTNNPIEADWSLTP